MATKEEGIYKRIAETMEYEHPDVIIHFDLSGVRLPIGLAKKAKGYNKLRGWPDLNVAEPKNGFAGLYVEIKIDSESPYYKKGEMKGMLKEEEHLVEQNSMLKRLRAKGYYTTFAVGYEETMQIIRDYMSGKFEKESN